MAIETTTPKATHVGPLTPYEQWLQREGVTVVRGYGVTDVRAPRGTLWERLGCSAYFVVLEGM